MKYTRKNTRYQGKEAQRIGRELGIPTAHHVAVVFNSNGRLVNISAQGVRYGAVMRLNYMPNRSWFVYFEQLDERFADGAQSEKEHHKSQYRLHKNNGVAREFSSVIFGQRHVQSEASPTKQPALAQSLLDRARRVCTAVGVYDDGTLTPSHTIEHQLLNTMDNALPLPPERKRLKRTNTGRYVYAAEARRIGHILGLEGATVARLQGAQNGDNTTIITACNNEFAVSLLSKTGEDRTQLHSILDGENRTMHIKGSGDHSINAAFRVEKGGKLKLVQPIPIRSDTAHIKQLNRMVSRLSHALG